MSFTGLLHFLTPETESSTLYHFAAVRQNPIPFPPEVAEEVAAQIAELRRLAFEDQDKPLLEAQQRNQEVMGETPQALFNVDVGGAAYRRILDDLIAQEQAG